MPLGFTSQDSYPINAIDCRFPTRIQSGILSNLCTSIKESSEDSDKIKVMILLHSNKKVIKGYRCEKKYSIFWEICGLLSHTKLYEPPTIRQPQIITPEECNTMRHTLTYQREDGTLTRISLNEKYQYNFIKHGKLHYSSDNVACEGASVMIHGEQVSSLVEMISAEIVIKTIEVEIDTDTAIDLDYNVKLPPACRVSEICQAGAESYVLEYPESQCPLSIIRTSNMMPVTVHTYAGDEQAVVDNENKIFLTIKHREIAPPGCHPALTLYATEFKDLKIVTSKLATTALSNLEHQLNPSQIDLDLEIKTSESYLAYYLQHMVLQQMQTITSKFCSMSSHNLHLNEISPFHANSLLRIRGDLIQELQCKEVTVVAKIGDKRTDKCSGDSLAVWLGNEPVRIQARTHLIVEEDPLEMIPCNAAYSPVFLASDNKTLLVATPEIKVVVIPLGHLQDDYLHLKTNNIDHPSFGQDLLYTAEEISQFNDLIHFQRTKTRVLNSLITDYCEENAQCGAYQPRAGTSEAFNLKHLEDVEFSPFQFLFDWSDKLSKIGNICSILIVLLAVTSTLFKCSKVLWLTIRHKMRIGPAIQLGLFVDTALMKVLLEKPMDHNMRSTANMPVMDPSLDTNTSPPDPSVPGEVPTPELNPTNNPWY